MSAAFTWSYLPGLPPYGEVHTFHREDELFVREGVVVEFSSENASWVGNFAPGLGTLSVVHVLGPSAFVIAQGAGYRVNLEAPAEYEMLQPSLITQSCVIEDLGVIVFAGLVNVCGYSMNGLMWATPRLSSDRLRLQTCTASAITGIADHFEGSEARSFVIEPFTGKSMIGRDVLPDPTSRPCTAREN